MVLRSIVQHVGGEYPPRRFTSREDGWISRSIRVRLQVFGPGKDLVPCKQKLRTVQEGVRPWAMTSTMKLTSLLRRFDPEPPDGKLETTKPEPKLMGRPFGARIRPGGGCTLFVECGNR